MNKSNIAKMNKMLANDVSLGEIAKTLGVEAKTLKKFAPKPAPKVAPKAGA